MKRSTLLLYLLLINVYIKAQPIAEPQIDRIAKLSMEVLNIPGMAVGIVRNGELVYAKGFGVKSLANPQKVDGQTLFGIASNSKAFTAAAIGILVDEGRLKWDDKVTEYIPEFKLYDPYVTTEFTIRDLLSHRSGLRPGAGDLMHDPDSSNFTIKDIIHGMQYLQPVSSFRSKFAYSNNFYLIAGEIISRISGMSWEKFIEERIMVPLKMNNSSASYHGIRDTSNVIDAHILTNGKAKVVSRYSSEVTDAAGGIYSNIIDLSKWVMMHLNDGKYNDPLSKRLLSQSVHHEMWSPQTIINVGQDSIYNTHFGAYGFGWFLIDKKGYKEIFHTGQDVGMVSEIALLPELNLGIILLINQETVDVNAIADEIMDIYLGVKGIDHITETAKRIKISEEKSHERLDSVWKEIVVIEKSPLKKDLDSYTGKYRDNWFGEVMITNINGRLYFKSVRSPQLTGELRPYKGTTFAIRWNNPDMNLDAFVLFNLSETGKANSFTMKAIVAANGYDFQDLNFKKAE